MNRTLYLAWQDRSPTRLWFPVGRLDVSSKYLYRFRYVQGAKLANREKGFKPLYDFPDFRKTYESATLFPMFKNRVIDENRGDFQKYLEFLDLKSPADPIEILSVDGGYKATDNFEIFPKIEPDKNGNFRCRFFLHGARHINPQAKQRLEVLNPEEKLYISIELTNPATGLAVQIMTEDYQMIGWAPRYLVDDLVHAMTKTMDYSAKVVRVNPQPAPSKQRVLVEMQGRWPGIKPMASDIFQPLAA